MYAYNPRKKSFHQLETTMVGKERWDILNTILKEMDIKKNESPKQHWMIIGPRGIGKSHLMTLLYHKVKDDKKLSRRWVPVLFPEELKMAGTLPKFLERTLNEIIREFEQAAKEHSIIDELKQKIREVKKSPTTGRADNFFSLIAWFYRETGKHILLLPENLQHLLGKKFQAIEQKKLRAFLQTSDAVLIIGTATTVFNALHDHSHPFYHFFHVRRLKDLEFEDMKTLITDILSQREKAESKAFISEEYARLKALHSFAGGNPRLAVFLADILSTEFPGEMIEIMDRTLDELTPYFESILQGVPDYLEEILNTLAAYEPAQSPAGIARHQEIPQTTIRKYLKKLKEDGYVKIAFSKGKSNYYCLNEYLYRIWFQMRDSSHREETRWLLELLLMVYSKETLLQEKNRLDTYEDGTQSPLFYQRLLNHAVEFMDRDPDYYRMIERCVESMKAEKDAEFYLGLPEAILRIFQLMWRYANDSFGLYFYLQERCNRFITPDISELNHRECLNQFFESANQAFSNLKPAIRLILLDQYDVVREQFQNIINVYLNKKEEKKIMFDLFIFTIKLNTLLKLIEGNINDAFKLIEIYLEYVKSLKTTKKKEKEVLNFSRDLFKIKIILNVDAINIQKVLKRMEEEEGLPFSDIFFKVWTCLSAPDSVEAQVYLSEKAIAEVVNVFKKDEEKAVKFLATKDAKHSV